MTLIIPPGRGGPLRSADAYRSVALDGSGAGEVTLGPVPSGQVWNVSRLAVFCTVDNPMPTALVYRTGPALPQYLVDGTYTGAQDFSDMNDDPPLEANEFLLVRWTGGQAAAVATAVLTGRQMVVGTPP
jgi:hypothetical protein